MSPTEYHLIKRYLAESLRRGLGSSRVIALLGARQAGKSTLVRELLGLQQPLSYQALDDIATRRAATQNPTGFITGLPRGAVIDEIQLVPELLLAIKRVVDLNRAPGQFVLTGSADLLFLPKVADALTGRVQYYELMPLAQSEIAQTNFNVVDALYDIKRFFNVRVRDNDYIPRILTGGYPESVERKDPTLRAEWFASYVTSLVRRDVADVAQIEDFASMELLLRLLGARSGTILNRNNLLSDLDGISAPTLKRYLTLLEWIFIVRTVPAWSANIGRRLTKSPKTFLNDTGLAAYLQYVTAERIEQDRSLLGPLLETFVHAELRKHAAWGDLAPQFFHWRDHTTKEELDLLLEARNGKRVGIEIKATATLRSRDYATISRLTKDPHMKLDAGIIFYTGETVIPIGENILAVPIAVFWSD